jgi:hypothetical protein
VSTLCTTPAKGMHPGHTVNIIHSFIPTDDVPVDDETHCLINCQEPVLAWHRQQLQLVEYSVDVVNTQTFNQT